MISERMKRRIEEMPDAQLIDWICLYCVDVRSTHSDDDAQEFINDIREVLEMRLNATEQPVSDGCKVPEGWKLVPGEPTEEMLIEGFESEPDESFSEKAEWDKYQAMSGCQQAKHRARLCWDAMLAAAPGGQ
ncbi:hypothetical protein ACRPHP_07055 [Pantoea allii]|uniref:hypothetical protein n=1 Tax=Pantoea allii TaxID=574096 RepID=UPI003D7A541B